VYGLCFRSRQDLSLRNHGFEYVSKPQPSKQFLENFKGLHKTLQLGPDAFSPRTSTHVHVNVSSLTVEETRTLVLLYALYEECFFMMVKPERRDNIHCVPLTETHLPAIYKTELTKYVQKWSKYTALNLLRIPDLGTIEFRHMHGTNDAEEMKQWLDVLNNLWMLCQAVKITEKSLTEKNILLWFEQVFKNVPAVFQIRSSLFEVIRNNLIDVKFSI
jgi:hypothetical protein